MPDKTTYTVRTKYKSFGDILASDPRQALINIARKNKIKYTGCIEVYNAELANVCVKDWFITHRDHYFYLGVYTPKEKVYLVNFISNAGCNTCITKYNGQPMDLVSKLLDIDKKHIVNDPVRKNTLCSIYVLDLQTGKKYIYNAFPRTKEEIKEEMKAGIMKNPIQIDADVKRFNNLLRQNVLKSFPLVTSRLWDDDRALFSNLLLFC